MKPYKVSTTRAYKAVTVVSPMMLGDETKDQDRARWYEPGQIACVCDGVTSSPDAAQAAELISSLIPVVFNGSIHEKLAMQCELLMALRQEAMENGVIFLPGNIPPAMQDMLLKVVQEKKANSFQTTMVAARFISDEKMVLADVIIFGDSAFFAFSPEGQLLTSSLTFPYDSQNHENYSPVQSSPSSITKKISFGPGDEILVRIEGHLSDSLHLAELAGIRTEHTHNWLVCTAVDSCCGEGQDLDENLSDLQALSLKVGDRLLVPKYLYGTQLTSKDQQYRTLRYSSTLRPILSKESSSSINCFNTNGPTTKVLPDHFYRGCFDSFQDRFPPQSHFILCSDGFYGGFSHWQQVWTWLQENAAGLNDKNEREAILKKLHHDLHVRSGDDDISFVWVQPKTPGIDHSGIQGGDNSCQQKL